MAPIEFKEVSLREWGDVLRERSGEAYPRQETVDRWTERDDHPKPTRRIGNTRVFDLVELEVWKAEHPELGNGRRLNWNGKLARKTSKK